MFGGSEVGKKGTKSSSRAGSPTSGKPGGVVGTRQRPPHVPKSPPSTLSTRGCECGDRSIFTLRQKKTFSPVNPKATRVPPASQHRPNPPQKNGTASSGGSPSPPGWFWCPCCPGSAGRMLILTPVSMVSPHLHRMLLRKRSCWQENKRGGRPGGPPPGLRGADASPFPRKIGVTVPFPSHPHGDVARRPPAHPRAGDAWKFGEFHPFG